MTEPVAPTVNVAKPRSRASQILTGVNDLLRDSNVISKTLGLAGQLSGNDVVGTVGDIVGQIGYGKRRRRRRGGVVRRRHHMRGGSLFGDILGTVGTMASAIPAAAFGGIQGATGILKGLGRKRRRAASHRAHRRSRKR